MKFKTSYIYHDDDGETTIELQDNLTADQVEPIGTSGIAYLHDTDASQVPYKRVRTVIPGPSTHQSGDPDGMEVSDDAVVLSMSESHIDYLVQV